MPPPPVRFALLLPAAGRNRSPLPPPPPQQPSPCASPSRPRLLPRPSAPSPRRRPFSFAPVSAGGALASVSAGGARRTSAAQTPAAPRHGPAARAFAAVAARRPPLARVQSARPAGSAAAGTAEARAAAAAAPCTTPSPFPWARSLATSAGSEVEWRSSDPASPHRYKYFDGVRKPDADDRGYRVLLLANKLQALVISDPAADKAAASLNVKVGQLSDPPELQGLAHFCEHLLFMVRSPAVLPSHEKIVRFSADFDPIPPFLPIPVSRLRALTSTQTRTNTLRCVREVTGGPRVVPLQVLEFDLRRRFALFRPLIRLRPRIL
ncbi:MAG: hypothetical protein BJ554DRAFT_6492 [Olpidium bornovanus]|uniref:Peptidase M16 N-terminal domain-containing protein n=1 Tax=Olpidium bornovanus TaxID=278681 RepID=A0A8H8DK54_9FUNG|nr:MAG: hypothetical protein BJ554DRAFT_6492 [Olpidium bornovanus]